MVAAAAGWLPLTARQGGGHLPVVRWLVERCEVPVDAANKDGRTALQWASKAGRLPAVAYLIDQVGGTSRS